MLQPLAIAPDDLFAQRQERVVYGLVLHVGRIAMSGIHVLVRLIHDAANMPGGNARGTQAEGGGAPYCD